MIDFIADNLTNSQIFQTMLKSSMLLGLAAGVIGVFITYKRKSIEINVFSTGSLIGILLVIIFFNSANQTYIFAGSVAAAVISNIILSIVYKTNKINKHIIQSLISAIFLGVSITLITYITQIGGAKNSGIELFLFGESTSLISAEYGLLKIVTVSSIVFIILFYKQLKLTVFNEEIALSSGICVKLYDLLIDIIVISIVAVGIKVVGVFFVICIFIIPALTARLLSSNFLYIMLISGIIGAFSGAIGGLTAGYASFVTTGVSNTLILLACFLSAIIFKMILQNINKKRAKV